LSYSPSDLEPNQQARNTVKRFEARNPAATKYSHCVRRMMHLLLRAYFVRLELVVI
jgi:hypothetical protein